jgi:U32 family peptidase
LCDTALTIVKASNFGIRNRGNRMKKPEILAPAGTKEAFFAAVSEGCDAIYLGGKEFGARAYATNFEWNELNELIQLAHINCVKVYYTLNTLVKDIEFNLLKEVLEHLSAIHIDAVILQDLGVFKYIRDHFPHMSIHGSTQMNLHHVKDVQFVSDLGFERVVLSRECSLEEIKKIKKIVNIEIETFVHGALCYCYSGLCLMSSIYGERSGNRGKCAQPCRLAYSLNNETAFFLSPKDQMTLRELPRLIEAGIDSFKIEGRMKSPEYVGLTTRLYRKYRDLYCQLKAENRLNDYGVDEQDYEDLNQIYNRGNFTSGYYEQHNSPSMISKNHSKHIGVQVGQVSVNNAFHFTFTKAIAKEDLLEIHLDELHSDEKRWPEFYLNADVKAGQLALSKLYSSNQDKINPKDFLQNKTYSVYRIRKQELNSALIESNKHIPKISLSLKVVAKKDNPLRLEITNIGSTANGYVIPMVSVIECYGNIVQKSNTRPIVEEDLRKQLTKTKDTPFELVDLIFDLEPDIFIPLKEINQLRRDILVLVEERMIEQYEKYLKHSDDMSRRQNNANAYRTAESNRRNDVAISIDAQKKIQKSNQVAISTHILVSSLSQLEQVLPFLSNKNKGNKGTDASNIDIQAKEYSIQRIYLDIMDMELDEVSRALQQIKTVKETNPFHVYLCYPHVFFEPYAQRFMKKIEAILQSKGLEIEGFLVRTLGTLDSVKHYNKPIALDYQLNLFNTDAVHFFEENRCIGSFVPSLELNGAGLKQIAKAVHIPMEIMVYHKTPLMHAANCLYKTRNNRCDYNDQGHALQLKDRKGMEQKVKCHCQMCYNTLYNQKPTFLMDIWTQELSSISVMRMDFTCEAGNEVKHIMELWTKTMDGIQIEFDDRLFTRGHYKRGVK